MSPTGGKSDSAASYHQSPLNPKNDAHSSAAGAGRAERQCRNNFVIPRRERRRWPRPRALPRQGSNRHHLHVNDDSRGIRAPVHHARESPAYRAGPLKRRDAGHSSAADDVVNGSGRPLSEVRADKLPGHGLDQRCIAENVADLYVSRDSCGEVTGNNNSRDFWSRLVRDCIRLPGFGW